MRLFDAHCHLQDSRLLPGIGAVLARAAAAGVERMVCCGAAEDDWGDVRALADAHPQILPAFGLHPWYVAERTAHWQEALMVRLEDPKAVVGEIGLDHAIDGADYGAQDEVFRKQLDMARELRRPATIHCRQAWGRMLEVLRSHAGSRPGILVHSFSGAAELVPELRDLGVWFSFSGSITRERNVRGRKALMAVPLDRLLIETDAPDIMPDIPAERMEGGRDASARVNEPANLAYVLRTVAELRKLEPDRLSEILWENSRRLFGGDHVG